MLPPTGTKYHSRQAIVPNGSWLYLDSDGAYEVTLPCGQMLLIEGPQTIIARVVMADGPQSAQAVQLIRDAQEKAEFNDDVSLIELTFD